MPRIQDFKDMVGVVTGASGGIGRALAMQLVRGGCHVAICDVREKELGETKKLLQSVAAEDVRVSAHMCDVTSVGDIERFRDETLAAHGGQVNLLINNAGLATTGSFLEMPRERFDKTFAVSFNGTVECTRAFLPTIVKQKQGYVVNLSSVNAFWCAMGPSVWPVKSPSHAPYSAAKAAVRAFSEALLHDSYQNFPHIGVAAVHPGHVGTDIAVLAESPDTPEEIEKMRILVGKIASNEAKTMNVEQLRKALGEQFKNQAPLTPAQAADIILSGVQRGSTRILVGEDAWVLDRVSRMCPRLIYKDWFMATVLGPWAISASKINATRIGRLAQALGIPLPRLAYPTFVMLLAYWTRRLGLRALARL